MPPALRLLVTLVTAPVNLDQGYGRTVQLKITLKEEPEQEIPAKEDDLEEEAVGTAAGGDSPGTARRSTEPQTLSQIEACVTTHTMG